MIAIKSANDEASMAALRRAITKARSGGYVGLRCRSKLVVSRATKTEENERRSNLRLGYSSCKSTIDPVSPTPFSPQVGVSYVASLGESAAARSLPPKATFAALSPAEIEAETLAAVDSLLPRPAMAKFAQMGSEVKRAQVRELGMLSLGVRLFNRARGLGGEDLDAASGDAVADAISLRKGLELAVQESLAYTLRLRRVVDFKAAASPPTDPLLVRLREELVYCLQFVSFAKALSTEILDTSEAVRTLCDQLEAELSQIKGTVGNNAAVPKERVFPMLDAAGVMYTLVREEKRALLVRWGTAGAAGSAGLSKRSDAVP